jgi:hypothetical protein
MMKELMKHSADYMFLAGILVIFLVGYFTSGTNTVAQMAFAVGLGISYVVWGVLHHRGTRMLTTRVVLEYFFVGLLATALLLLINA